MKRLLATLTLILCLSFPVLAGHRYGRRWYCDCNDPNSHVSGQSLNISDGHEGTLDNTEQPTTPDMNWPGSYWLS